MQRRIIASLLSAFSVLAVFLNWAAPGPHLGSSAYAASADNETIVHLFEWTWPSVAAECPRLASTGFGAVQVSPPQEHIVLPTRNYPWWQDYQPISYQLTSRRGDREAFSAMVEDCRKVGVKIYVDAVINHMSGSDNTGQILGSAGNSASAYNYPAVPYSNLDFHPACPIANYGDRNQVQNCQLSSLTDLRTETPYVRTKIANYLKDLLSLGVAGFRIDAAKHIPAADLAAIKSEAGGDPYIYQEVIEGGPGEPQLSEYTGIGDVTDFRYGDIVGSAFRDQNLASLANVPERMALGTDQAQVFIDNHDTERNGRTKLNYTNGDRYYLAEGFMLAYPFGTPSVMSGYSFTTGDQGPPAESNGKTTAATCGNGTWTCQHRDSRIAGLAGFRKATLGQSLNNWWTNGSGQIAFGRGSAGYVVFNGEPTTLNRTFATSLPPGDYCNVAASAVCEVVTVAADGSAIVNIPPLRSLALHRDARPNGSAPSPSSSPSPSPSSSGIAEARVSVAVTATTYYGQNVFIVGNIPALGQWSPSRAVPLSAASYPTWRATLTLPLGPVEYKYLKKNPDGSIIWESGANRSLNVVGDSTLATQNWD